MDKIVILEPLLNSYQNKLFFKSKEPNLSILRAITVFKTKYKTIFIDFKTDFVNKTKIKKEISNTKLLFINIKSYNLLISSKIIKLAKKINPDITIYLFGQLPEAKPLLFRKKFPGVRIITQELYEFATEFCSGKKIDKKQDLDKIPKIDIHEMKKRDYYTVYPMKQLKYNKWAFLNLSEGCSHNCIFCSQTLRITHGHKIINFTVEESIKRIKRLLKAGFNTIRFSDDDFLSNSFFVNQLCKEIIKQNIKFRWMSQVRADKLSDKTIFLMKQAGCECVNFGIESGSERILKILKKGETLDKIKKAIKLCKKHNLKLVTYFMIGNPSETKKEILKSMKFSFKIKPDVLQLGFFTPYEGSPFYEENKKIIEERITLKLFHYNPSQINFSNVSSDLLKKLYLSWNLKYYLFHPIKSFSIILNMFLFYPKRTFRIIKQIAQA